MALTDRATKRDVAPASFEVVACGADTVSVSWRPRADDADWWDMLSGRLRAGWIDHASEMPIDDVAQPECRMKRSAAGGYVSQDTVSGGKLMVWPRARRIAVEGRLAVLLSGDASAEGLRAPALITEAAELAAAELRWLGLLEGDETSFGRRLDLATDVLWADPRSGAAVLDALADAAPATGYKLNSWTAGHGAETVTLYDLQGRRRELVGRAYDRGDSTRQHPHGRLLRLERQLRWQGEASPSLADVTAFDWTGEALDWLGLMRADRPEAVALDDRERLLGLIEAGEVPVETGLRLLGSLVMRQRRDPVAWAAAVGQGAATERKHRRELAALGLPAPAPTLVVPDLDLALRAAAERWRALVGPSGSPG